jgi:hypothetical protein
MHIVARDRKWIIEGVSEGWVAGLSFPTKWKAEVALRVYQNGGGKRDYWAEVKRVRAQRPRQEPNKKRAELERALKVIQKLKPTDDDISEFAETAGYGTVTRSEDQKDFPPHIHNTWGKKSGGSVHIDIGCCGYHLMLTYTTAVDFIRFIKTKRQ